MSMMEEIKIDNDDDDPKSREVNNDVVNVDKSVGKKPIDNVAGPSSGNNQNIDDGQYKNVYTEDTLSKLKDGILNTYQPPLEHLEKQLGEVTMKQSILYEQLHNENLNLAQKQNSDEMQEVFKKISLYRNKLVNMKTEMRSLHDQSQKLVKRAVRLQQLKEKDDAAKQEQREKEVKLIGNK